MDQKLKRNLRAALKWSLRPEPFRRTEERDGTIKTWFERKLNGLAAYSFLDGTEVSARAIKLVRLHYVEGRSVKELAIKFRISPRTVADDMVNVLDKVLEHAPHSILVCLSPNLYQWKPKACLHCGCDLYWDSEGAHGGDGEWVGNLCSRRFDYQMNQIGK